MLISPFFHFSTSEQALMEQNRLREDLQSDVGSSKDRVQEIQKQLDDVLEQLGDARTDKHEDARRKKKQEIVERFKSNYPGVVSLRHFRLFFNSVTFVIILFLVRSYDKHVPTFPQTLQCSNYKSSW